MTNYEKLRMRLNKLHHYIFGKKFYKKIHFNFSNDFMRWNLINKIIQKKGFTSYLEIGCYQDETFSKVKIEKKVGVDPISGGTLRQTSDAFFSTNRDFFDLIFIDGHHVYDQVIKDINNSLGCLNKDGTILVHDCLPASFFQQAVPRSQHIWTGDVWKAIAMIGTNPDLYTHICCIDYGVGIILRKPNENILNISMEKIKKMTYKDFFYNYKKMFNLITFDQVDQLLT